MRFTQRGHEKAHGNPWLEAILYSRSAHGATHRPSKAKSSPVTSVGSFEHRADRLIGFLLDLTCQKTDFLEQQRDLSRGELLTFATENL